MALHTHNTHEDNPILRQARSQEIVVAPVTAVPDLTPSPVQEPVEVIFSSTLDAVQSALSKASARIEISAEGLEAGVEETAAATDIISQAMSDIAAAEQTVARSKLNSELQAQNTNIDLVEAAGGREAQVTLISTFTEESNRLADLLDLRTDIVNDKHIGIQIIDSIINGFRVAGIEEEINTVADEQAQTAFQINTISGAQDSFTRVNLNTKKTLNEADIEANLKLIAAQNDFKGGQQEIINVHSKATAMDALVTSDTKQISNQLQNLRVEQEAAQLEITKKRQEIQIQQLEFDKKKLEIDLPRLQISLERNRLQLSEEKFLAPSKRVALEAKNVEIVRNINDLVALEGQQAIMVRRAQSAAGLPVETPEIITNKLRQGGNVGAKYERLRNIGAFPEAKLGGTAADANTTLLIVDPESTVTQTKGIGLIMAIRDRQAAKYQADLAKPGFKLPIDKATLDADFNVTATEVMGAFAANISLGNPYHAPPMASLETLLVGKGIALYDKIIKAKGFQEVNAQLIVDAAIEGIQAKAITAEEAASGIEAIFEAAAAFNNTTFGGFARVGLPDQLTYNTSVRKPIGFFAATVIGAKSLLPGALIKRATGKGLTKLTAEFVRSSLETIDFMDITKIQELIIRELSATKPVNPATPNTTPNSPAPKTTQVQEQAQEVTQ